MPPNLDKYFLTAMQLVKRAGQLTRAAYEQPVVVVHTKSSPTDLVTETDQAVENLLITGLKQSFPECKFIGEESAAAGMKYTLTNEPTWIIDPIDGTTNFVHRIPHIAICVGLTVAKEPVLGIVYNPITNECYTAIKGRGAFKNGLPIHVSHAEALNKSVICTSLGIHNLVDIGASWMDIALDNHRKSVFAGVRGHRAFGSAAINTVYCAQGSVDAYIEYGIHSWDICAAVVIHREAGGIVMDPTGKPFDLMSRRLLCASTEPLAKEISELFTHVEYEPEGEHAEELEEQAAP